MTALDRLAEKHGPGSDKTHPLFAALWELCPATPLGSECYATNCKGYHRRSRAEAVLRLLRIPHSVRLERRANDKWWAAVRLEENSYDWSEREDSPEDAIAAAVLAANEEKS